MTRAKNRCSCSAQYTRFIHTRHQQQQFHFVTAVVSTQFCAPCCLPLCQLITLLLHIHSQHWGGCNSQPVSLKHHEVISDNKLAHSQRLFPAAKNSTTIGTPQNWLSVMWYSCKVLSCRLCRNPASSRKHCSDRESKTLTNDKQRWQRPFVLRQLKSKG